MKRLACALAAVLSLLVLVDVQSAAAVIIDGNHASLTNFQSADGMNYSLDTATNLEWLDISTTTEMTFDEVTFLLGPGQELHGFRYATSHEVVVYMANVGLSLGFYQDPSKTLFNTLAAHHGSLGFAGSFERIQGMTSTPFSSPGFVRGPGVFHNPNAQPPFTVVADGSGNGIGKHADQPYIGSWLVHEAGTPFGGGGAPQGGAIPEPASGLVWGALAMLGLLSRHRASLS